MLKALTHPYRHFSLTLQKLLVVSNIQDFILLSVSLSILEQCNHVLYIYADNTFAT